MCELDRARLIAWIDDELEPPETDAVELHVRGCAECGGAIGAIRSLSADVAGYARALAAPPERKWRWFPAAAAAAVLFAAALQLTDTAAVQPPPVVSAPAASDPRIVFVAVPLQDLLPIGAAPPGAVIVGEVVLDIGGAPRTFRLLGSEPQGD